MIRKQVYNSSTLQTTTDYIDGFVYITQGTGSPLISYFPMPEGRVLNTSSSGVTLVKEFIVTDQQGNARVSFRDGGSGTPVVYQENSYYGFGLVLPNSPVGTTATANKQLYNGGSEWQNDYSNLPDYYQTYYRNYDAALARWVGVDPMAEASSSISVYHYSGNNPIMYNDPIGDKINPDKVLKNAYDSGMPSHAEAAVEAQGENQGMSSGFINEWWEQGIFDTEGPGSPDGGAGARAAWLPSEMSGGALDTESGNIIDIYHAGSSSSMTSQELGAVLAGTGTVNINPSIGSWTFITSNAEANGYGEIRGGLFEDRGNIAANQGGDPILDALFGSTQTMKTGIQYDDIKTVIGNFGFSSFSSVSQSGGEHLFNLNTTQFNSQKGSKITSDANINLFVYKMKFTSDIGLEQEFGTTSWNVNIGLSWEKGLSVGAAVNGYGFDANYRPNVVGLMLIGVAIAQPELFPAAYKAVTSF